MINCFFHPRTESVGACKRCMIPVCAECQSDQYCRECGKLVAYMKHGHTGGRRGDIVMEDQVRRASLTRQLVLQRLEAIAFGKPVPTKRAAAPLPKTFKKPARKDSRAPMAITAAAVVVAFGLGMAFARPPAQAVAPAQEAADPASNGAFVHVPDSRMPSQQAPLGYSNSPSGGVFRPAPVTARRLAPDMPALAPREVTAQAPMRHTLAPLRVTRIALAPDPAQAAPAPALAAAAAPVRPSAAITWPVAGNTLRLTSYVRVRVENPGQVAVLNIAVDGKPFVPAQRVEPKTEIPIDTTRLANGEHRLQVMAMTESGEFLSGEEIPVSISN